MTPLTATVPNTVSATRSTTNTLVNDTHSALNPTWVRGVDTPQDFDSLRGLVQRAAREDRGLAVCGARHAMGGQQFATNSQLIDMRGLNRVLDFDRGRGLIHVEAGIQWPELVEYLQREQRDATKQWGIRQKQTGADQLTLGGAVSANVHGRGLQMAPLAGDIEALDVVDARGEMRRISRTENPELFRLVVGGYGLFGIVYGVVLRLNRRTKLRRRVDIIDGTDVMAAFDDRIADGAMYGDFQFSTDERSDGFLSSGVLSCYAPVPDDMPVPGEQRVLTDADWQKLVYLSHSDKARAYELYTEHYRATDGQLYWSDSHQMSTYLEGYHGELDRKLGAACPGSEIISEVYVPRPALASFLHAVCADFRQFETNLIYGTVRLIERDTESFLAWARQPWACIVFNLHTDHTCAALERTADAFRRLISRAIEFGGSFFLTYHRYATRAQLLKCYPELPRFISAKRHFDPDDRFQSDWYKHLAAMMPVV